MHFVSGFVTCFAVGVWLYFNVAPDTLQKLGANVKDSAVVEGLEGSVTEVSSELPDGPKDTDSGWKEPAAELQPEAAVTPPPVALGNRESVSPEEALRELRIASEKMLEANQAFKARAAELAQRERDVAEREAAPAPKRRKQKQQEVAPPPPSAPQLQPQVLAATPASPVYYQCCGCCNCCSCGCHEKTYVVTRRVGLVGRLFGRR